LRGMYTFCVGFAPTPPRVRPPPPRVQGSHPQWNFRTRHSPVSTAAPNSSSLPGNNCFSTTSNSRTNLSAAKPASLNASPFSVPRPLHAAKDITIIASKLAPPAPNAARTPPFPSAPRRAGRSFVASASLRERLRPAPDRRMVGSRVGTGPGKVAKRRHSLAQHVSAG
jgi:hypothetical protein